MNKKKRRRRLPIGVIFVDLDEDVIFSDENEDDTYVRLTKSEILRQGIPGKDGDKLRRALRKLFEESSSSTTIARTFLSYASSHTPDTMTPGDKNTDPIRRRSGSHELLESYDLAFHKTIRPVTQFAAKLGVSSTNQTEDDVQQEIHAATTDGNHHFKKWNNELEDGIRHSFLRVLISLLRDYADYIRIESCSEDNTSDAKVMVFSDQEFLKEFSKKDRKDLANAIVTSQMFEHYLQDRNMHDSTSKFFDEMIKKKKARSKLSKFNSKSK